MTILCFQGWWRRSGGNSFIMCNWTLRRRITSRGRCGTLPFLLFALDAHFHPFLILSWQISPCARLYTSALQLESCLSALRRVDQTFLSEYLHWPHLRGFFFSLSYCAHIPLFLCHDATLLVLSPWFASKRHEVSLKCFCCFSTRSIILWWFLTTNQDDIEKFSLWTLWVWWNVVVYLFHVSCNHLPL